MPRKAFFTKDEIINKAIEVIRKRGINALTARELGKYMGCSTSPLITVFGSFEEIRSQAIATIYKQFEKYIEGSLDYTPAFKEYGKRLVAYGKDHPELFKVLLMRDGNHATSNHVESVCKEAMMRDYNLTVDEAESLMHQCFITAIGLGTQLAVGGVNYTDAQIDKHLGFGFIGTLLLLKNPQAAQIVAPHVRKDNEGITLDITGLNV